MLVVYLIGCGITAAVAAMMDYEDQARFSVEECLMPVFFWPIAWPVGALMYRRRMDSGTRV
jgi:hypothetical protein